MTGVTGRTRALIAVLACAVLAVFIAGPKVARAHLEMPDPEVESVRIVRVLADPHLDGRGIGTAGLDSAARFIADYMHAWGLKPAGDEGTYFQSLEVTTGVVVDDPCGLTAAARTFATGENFQPLGFSTSGGVRAEVVFAGYGITAPAYGYDDFAGVDVRDRMVLVLTHEPGEMGSSSKFDGARNTPYAELRTKAINAREHGAIGMLVANGPIFHAGEPLRAPRADGGGYMTSGLIAAAISDSVAGMLMRRSGKSLLEAQRAIDRHEKPQSFALGESASVTVTLRRKRATIRNVVGMVTGRDTSRTLVIGAHYDHLGDRQEESLAPDSHLANVGADDNASGVAAMLGVAREIGTRAQMASPPEHTLLFCAFTGEEIGLVGSGHFVEDPPRPIESVEGMLNMDNVGRLRDNQLTVMGVGTASELPEVVANVNRARPVPFAIKTSTDGYGPSDHSSFYKRQVPVLFLFTGAHADDYKPSDTRDKINGEGLGRVSTFAEAMIETLDARPRLHYTRAKSDSSVGRIAGGGGYGAWLGTIPDYMQTEGGVKLSGVRSGGPGELAGLAGGDVIIGFDGVHIDNIYDYTFALRSRKPGQSVRIEVKRGDRTLNLVATLGRRP